jgi:DNA-binding beta-propeller fold protein YncE
MTQFRSRRHLRRWRSAPLVAAAIALSVPATAAASGGHAHRSDDDVVVVANRGSGDVSVIDADDHDVATYDLPGAAEPMYVSHDRKHGRVLVGDRSSSTVVALDEDTFDVVGSVDVGEGVFHQWLDPRRGQLWVVGDASASVTVVDTADLDVIATIAIPPDLVARGGVPHDVFVRGRHAFVSILGLDDGSGAVLRYSTRTFRETGRLAAGGDPHLFVRWGVLHVASQDASTVSTYRVGSLRPLASVDIPAAHGIWVTRRGDVLVTNIAGGGVDAVWDLDRRLGVDDVTDTTVPVPHNLVELDGEVFVTHSGATADQVSIIDRARHGRDGFGTAETVTVGANPFGLAAVDR